MKYYKCVHKRGVELTSIVHANSVLEVVYTPGEFVRPHIVGSSLMVFDNIEDANNFAINWYGEIWECEVESPSAVGIFVKRDNCNSEWVERTIHEIIRGNLLSECNVAIKGTVFCSAVKLLRCVTPN